MRIVLGMDGSPQSFMARDLVAATSWSYPTSVLLVGAYERPIDWTGMVPVRAADEEDEVVVQIERELHEAAAPLRKAGQFVEVRAARGTPAHALMEAATTEAADLIVVGTRNRGRAATALLGSVSATLVDHAPCPVFVARSPRVDQMLVATDGSDPASLIPTVLDRWDAFADARIDVVSVAPPLNEEAILPSVTPGLSLTPSPHDEIVQRHRDAAERMAAELRELGYHANATVRVGHAVDEIARTCQENEIDLVVTGSRGLGTFERLVLGSVAHGIVVRAPSSVLVIRGGVPARVPEPRRVTETPLRAALPA
jgi:nucleotide-binding universal stress UspA family protein